MPDDTQQTELALALEAAFLEVRHQRHIPAWNYIAEVAERHFAPLRETCDRLALNAITDAAKHYMSDDAALARAARVFLAENPAPTGSKADRADYIVTVSCASLRRLHDAAEKPSPLSPAPHHA